MITDIIGKRYAQAIYEVAEDEGKVMELYDNLQSVMNAYYKDTEFKRVFDHPKVTIDNKKKMINNIFGKSFDEFTIKIIDYIIDRDRFIYIKSIVKEYLKIYYVRNKIVEVDAVFAIAPTEEQITLLVAKLEKSTGKKVKLRVEVDTSLIGGGVIKIGDKIIDGSLKRQFEMLKVSL